MRSDSTPSRNRNFRRIFQGILIGLSLCAAPPNAAFAQGAQASEAARQIDEARGARDRGDWTRAVELLTAAYQIWPQWTIALELGQAELQTGACQQAIEHLEWAATHSQADAVRLRSLLDQANEAKGRSEALKILSSDPNAKLYLDGKPMGEVPSRGLLCVPPGFHRLEGHKITGEIAYTDIEVQPGQAATARLSDFRHKLPESEQEITEKGLPAWKVWGVAAGIGLSAAALGFGIGYHVKANQESDNLRAQDRWLFKTYDPDGILGEIDKICTQITTAEYDCNRRSRRIELRNMNQIGAAIAYTLSGVFAAGTLVVLTMAIGKKREPERGHLKIAPAMALQYQGMQVSGEF